MVCQAIHLMSVRKQSHTAASIPWPPNILYVFASVKRPYRGGQKPSLGNLLVIEGIFSEDEEFGVPSTTDRSQPISVMKGDLLDNSSIKCVTNTNGTRDFSSTFPPMKGDQQREMHYSVHYHLH